MPSAITISGESFGETAHDLLNVVVQRTNFEMGDGGNTQVNIKDSVVQRSDIGKYK